MATELNSNLQMNVPSPTIEGERKKSGTTYIDYADEADVNTNTEAAYRVNKYFWIAGNLYYAKTVNIQANTTEFQLIGGVDTEWQTTDDFFDM